jgi:hypothetical protein
MVNLSPISYAADFGHGMEAFQLTVQTDPYTGEATYVLEESETELSPGALKMASAIIDFSKAL